jgi:predicted dehydrogenase
MTLRVAVIGLGPIGNRHSMLYTEDDLAELVGVCDIIKEKADAASEKYNAPAFYDAETMLKELQPDVVSITTGGYENSSDHYEPTMQALSAGCNVLGEKPISNEIAKAEEMVAKAKEMGFAMVSTSITALPPLPVSRNNGWMKARWDICSSSIWRCGL